MNRIAILAIDIYKYFLSVILKNIVGSESVCRFDEHCDDFAKRMFREKGFIKGFYFSLLRLSKCHPYSFKLRYGNI